MFNFENYTFSEFSPSRPPHSNKKHTRLNCNLLKLPIFFKSSPSLCNQEIKQDSFFERRVMLRYHCATALSLILHAQMDLRVICTRPVLPLLADGEIHTNAHAILSRMSECSAAQSAARLWTRAGPSLRQHRQTINFT